MQTAIKKIIIEQIDKLDEYQLRIVLGFIKQLLHQLD